MNAEIETIRTVAAEDGRRAVEELDGAADALRADLYRRSLDWFTGTGKDAARSKRAIMWRIKGMTR